MILWLAMMLRSAMIAIVTSLLLLPELLFANLVPLSVLTMITPVTIVTLIMKVMLIMPITPVLPTTLRILR